MILAAFSANHSARILTPAVPATILVPIALFASLSRRGLSMRNEVSRAKAPPAKRSEKGDGDENGRLPVELSSQLGAGRYAGP